MLKQDILGNAACRLAMQLELREQLMHLLSRPPTKTVLRNGHHTLQNTKTSSSALKFSAPLMYGGQGEHKPRDTLVFSSSATQDNHAGWQSDTPGDTLVPNESEGSNNIMTHTATISTTTTSKGGKHDTGLDQPRLQATGKAITGANKNKMHSENRRRQRTLQQAQTTQTLWENHTSTRVLPATAADKSRPAHRNYMCPAELALTHPAAETLLDWATFGCPTKTGNNWS